MNVRVAMSLAGLLAAACAASPGKVVKTFELAKPAGAPFARILVVGAHEDRAVRRQFEATLTDALRARQADALSSIEIMPSGEALSEETVGAAARESRVDAVLVTRLKDVRWSAAQAEERTTTVARRKEADNLLDFFRYDYVEHPDPVGSPAVRTVVVSSDFYRVADRTRIWSVESTAVEKETAMGVVEDLAASIVAQLHRDGLIE